MSARSAPACRSHVANECRIWYTVNGIRPAFRAAAWIALYGVYDMARNEAWVSVGWDHDTPTFAVASIRHW